MTRTGVHESLENMVLSLERTAAELNQLIASLRRALGSQSVPQPEDPPRPSRDWWPGDPSTNGFGRLVWIAKKLREHWSGVVVGSVMSVGSIKVDLATAQGRWQLMILAVLRGARVRERSIEETFAALVQQGLTDLERLATGGPQVELELLQVFTAHYRALTSRQSKVDALMTNAALLKSEYGGDLHNLYLALRDDSEALIKALRRFKQVGQVAYWMCRTLKVHGIWPDLGPEATQYLDRYTDLPLERLELRVPFDEERPGSTAMRFAAKHLGGDTVPLYLQGFILCSQNDVTVCRSECSLASECRYAQKAE